MAGFGGGFRRFTIANGWQTDKQIPRSGACQLGPERVAKALFRDLPDRSGMRPGPQAQDAQRKTRP